jgi:hypothetical protein
MQGRNEEETLRRRAVGSFLRGVFGALVLWVKLGGKAILGGGRQAGRSFHPKHRSTKGAGALQPRLGACENLMRAEKPV